MRRFTSILLALILIAVSVVVISPSPTQAQAAWAPNTSYAVGALVTYGGHVYKCIQAHTSQVGWEPPNVPALWQDMGTGGSNPTNPPPPPPSGATVFSTSLESGQTQPTWTNSVETQNGGINNVGGICCGLTGPELGTRAEGGHTGNSALMYSGMDNSASSSFAYMEVFSVSIAVTSTTSLSYWIYPQSSATSNLVSGNNSSCVAIDMVFTDGSNLRDSGVTDQKGNQLHPAHQCGQLSMDTWNNVTANLGRLSGKTIARINVAYDQPGNTGGYRGYVDDISISSTPVSSCTYQVWAAGQIYYKGTIVLFPANGNYYLEVNNGTNGSDGTDPTISTWYWQPTTCSGGGSNTPTFVPPTNVPPPPPSGKVFAPYIDVSPGSGSAIMQLASNGSGNKHYSLAFILGSGCNASWFGAFPMNTSEAAGIGTDINNLRAAGGDVIVSFGGAAAPELANVCPDAGSLQAQYQSVVSKYNLNTVDFDIEDFNPTAIDIRNKALRGLEGANPNLKVHYTLGVLQSGFTSSQNSVLQNAASNGTRVDLVNIMTMDYGGAVGDMGAAAISAAQAARSQLNGMGFGGTQLGITPMIGVNDSAGETFTLANASSLVSWANSNGIALIGFWSIGRDNGGCPGGGAASASCSGISQSNFQFSSIFHGFAN